MDQLSRPELKIFSGSAHRDLSQSIARSIGIPLGDASVKAFPDGETSVRINENIRGRDVFIIQPTCPPVNHNLMELLVLVDAARRASAARITAVMPFFGYARQDRKDRPRVPITAKLVANLITAAGVNRVLTAASCRATAASPSTRRAYRPVTGRSNCSAPRADICARLTWITSGESHPRSRRCSP